MLQTFFDSRIPNMVRAGGEEYLHGKMGEEVRIRAQDERIYFKWPVCIRFCRRVFMNERQIENLRMFLSEKGIEHDRTCSLGRWYRSTISVPYVLFDSLVLEHWVHPEKEEPDA